VQHLTIVVVLLVWTYIAPLARPQIDRVTRAQQIISALLDWHHKVLILLELAIFQNVLVQLIITAIF
jgi:hypothetical protein